MTVERRRIVQRGYDDVADTYLQRFGASTVRRRWLGRFMVGLPETGAHVLDLGCGAGVPVVRELVAAGHVVTGVDGSHQQIVRARRNVPSATFLEEDMCRLDFEHGRFDGVCAFYSIIHVPPSRQAALVLGIARWLKPNGVLVATFGAGTAGEWIGDWLGTIMFFGQVGEGATLDLLADAGLQVRHAAVEKQDDEETEFLWVEARKRQGSHRRAVRPGPPLPASSERFEIDHPERGAPRPSPEA